jgi:hypothetical protein
LIRRAWIDLADRQPDGDTGVAFFYHVCSCRERMQSGHMYLARHDVARVGTVSERVLEVNQF